MLKTCADCSLTAWKKMSLDKSLQIHGKSWKTVLNPEGYSYRQLCKQRNEGRKKKKIANNKHLSLINLYLPEQRRPACTAQARHLTGSCVNVFHSLNKPLNWPRPFLPGNLSFSNKLTSESVFLWVITRSFVYSAPKSFMFGKVTTR